MNYKTKWWLSLLIFPLVSLFPLIIYAIINSFGDAGSILLPDQDNIAFAIFLIYIPIYFFIELFRFNNENSWKSFKWQIFSIIIVFALIYSFFTGLIYGGVSNSNKDGSFFLLILWILLLEFIGTSIMSSFSIIIFKFSSYSGPLNKNIYNLATKYVVTFTIKKWNMYLDSYFELNKQYFENYSILFTTRAIYILDELKEEDNLEIYFEHEIFEKTDELIDFESMLTSDNFNFSTVKNIESEDEFSLKIKKEVVDQIPKKAPSIKNIVETKRTIEPSEYILNIIQKRKALIESIKQNLGYSNLTISDFEKVPIINVVIIPDSFKPSGSNEDFLITNSKNFISKINRMEKLLEYRKEIKEIRKIYKKKRV